MTQDIVNCVFGRKTETKRNKESGYENESQTINVNAGEGAQAHLVCKNVVEFVARDERVGEPKY